MVKIPWQWLLFACTLGLPFGVHADGALALRLSQQSLSSFPTQVFDNASYRADSGLKDVAPRTLQQTGVSLHFTPARQQVDSKGAWDFELFTDQTTRLGGTAGTFAALNALAGDRTALGTGLQLPFTLTGQLMQRRGMGAAHTFLPQTTDWGSLTVRTGLRLFAVNRFRAIDASGVLTETHSGNQQLAANTQDYLLGGNSPFINPQKNLGMGMAFSVEATLGNPKRSHLMLSIADIGPPINIAHVLQTQQSINSNTLSYDSRGYVQFAPAISGQYRDVAYKAKQYPSYSLQGAMESSQVMQWLGRVHYSYPLTQYAGGVQWRFASDAQQLQALLYVSPQLPASTALAWQHPSFSIQWRGDSLLPNRAKVWGLDGRVTF